MPHSVLVVDDDESICLLIKKVLARSGYDARTATSQVEAVRIFEAYPVDLLIVDKTLPGFSGLDLLNRFRREAPDLPAVLMTAFPEPIMTPATKIQGYLAKPFESLKLISTTVDGVFEMREQLNEARGRQRAFNRLLHSDSSNHNTPA